ncbi:MAG: ABC transporter permease [Devosia nanyangense]|uniref:ABC transporter permease n=1 Tax=Devosia nanyangense TaxID=1228055 RepID=A0A933L4I9_9HYPH|nr:ABC transporter permease [Devosia nanyangense]
MTRSRLAELLLRNMTVFIFLAVFLYFGVQAPRFFGVESIANIVKQASFIGVIAVGMTFVLLTAGIDLSVGSNMYLSAMAAGYVLQNPALQNGWGVLVALLAGLSTGIVFGAINAFCIVVLRITPFLVTLATLVAGRGVGTAITESFGIEYPPPYLAFGASGLFGIPMPIVVFAVVVLAAHIVLSRTQFGRQIYAVGRDPEAARKAGIAVDRITFSVYVICGLCAAIGGVTLIALIGRLNQTFGVGKEFDVITAAVLGGTSLFGGAGTAWGAVVGSSLVQMVQSGMIFVGVNIYLQPMVLAAIIFLAILIDSLRNGRLEKLRRRRLRPD